MFKKLFETISQATVKPRMWTKQHSPEILVGLTIAGTVGAVATAVIATKKSTKVVDEAKPKLNELREQMKDETGLIDKNITKKEIRSVYIHTGTRLAKYYLPTILLVTLSVTSSIGGNRILRKREAALASALSITSTAYSAYRDKVKKKLGEEVESKIFDGTDNAEKTGKSKDGNEKPLTKEDISQSGYAVWFDESCPEWEDDGAINLRKLQYIQEVFNHKLRVNGAVFLGDIYDELGYTLNSGLLSKHKMQAARVVGWLYKPTNAAQGDNYISFGLTNPDGTYTAAAQRMLHGEKSILLDFNVDGCIIDNFAITMQSRKREIEGA